MFKPPGVKTTMPIVSVLVIPVGIMFMTPIVKTGTPTPSWLAMPTGTNGPIIVVKLNKVLLNKVLLNTGIAPFI
jgi:hypothetical protein